MRGNGYASGMVMSLSIRKSTHIRYVPSFFLTITIPDANGDFDSRMSPAFSSSLIVSSADCFFSVFSLLGAWRKYSAPGRSTMSCSTRRARPMSVLFLQNMSLKRSKISSRRVNSFSVHRLRRFSISGLVGKAVGFVSGSAIGNSESLAELKSDDGSGL